MIDVDRCTELAALTRTQGPTINQIIKCKPPEWIPLLAIGSVGLVIITALIIRGVCRFAGVLWTHTYIAHKSRTILFYYLVNGLINFFKILNPRALEVYDFIGDVLEGLLVFTFYNILWDYLGGYIKVLPKVVGKEVSVNCSIFCCFKCSQEVTLKFVWIYEKLVMQFPIAQLLLVVIDINTFVNGPRFGNGSVTLNQAKAISTIRLVIKVLQAMSGMLSLYGLDVLQRVWKKENEDKKIAKKISVFRATIVFNRLQAVIFNRVGLSVDQVGALTGFYRAATWNGFLILIENAILSFFVYKLYTPDDITNREDYKSTFTDLEQCEEKVEIASGNKEAQVDDEKEDPAI